ncbi:unnamed protein product [Candida parapsilosis]
MLTNFQTGVTKFLVVLFCVTTVVSQQHSKIDYDGNIDQTVIGGFRVPGRKDGGGSSSGGGGGCGKKGCNKRGGGYGASDTTGEDATITKRDKDFDISSSDLEEGIVFSLLLGWF